jgi:hypothetical protein
MGTSDWIAIAAVVSSIIVTAVSVWHARTSAREERQQERVAETYVTLTDYCLRTQQFARTTFPSVTEDSPMRDPPFTNEEWLALRARVFLYGSDPVRTSFDRLLELRARTSTELGLWREALDAVDRGGTTRAERDLGMRHHDRLNEAAKKLDQTASELVGLLRSELR